MRKKSFKSAFFIVLFCILLINTFKTEVFAQTTPKIGIVSLDHVPFVEGNNNEFYISSKSYTGQVQYQLFYIQESVMKEWKLINNEDMVNGWTNPIDAQTPSIVDISNLNLKADKYRFAIRVRRVGVKGLYANKYGDYDDAYPFNVDVVKSTNIDLSGNINIPKTNFSKNESLVIDGVGNLSKDIQYKLHLFDVKNNKWLTDLTQYNTSVNYSLKDIPEGTYIVDLWAKNINSKNKYDGWKLKTITVQNSSDKIVKFPDSNLDTVIRELLNKPNGDIYRSDVEKIESIEWYLNPDAVESIPEEEMIFDLSGIENLVNLKVLKLQGNSISDISQLAGLTNLTEIDLYYNNLSDISALKGLTNLTYLSLSNNKISDINALKGLTNLEEIYLTNNQINDLSALAGLTNLFALDLHNNQISNISALKGMTDLMWLDLSKNKLSDTSVLAALTNLTDLRLGYNSISAISTLTGLTNLETLLLEHNNISNISALKGLTNITLLNIDNNHISDISALSELDNLQLISFASNGISDISVLKELTSLIAIYSDNNKINDISPLEGLTNLTIVSFASNEISDISILSGLTNLIALALENNNISDTSALKGLNNLTELYLKNNKISDADMQALKNALPESVEFK